MKKVNKNMAQGNVIFLQFAQIIGTCSTIDFMRQNNLLHKEYYCCNTQASIVSDTYGCSDGQIFQCNICLKRYPIRKHSFFSKSKLCLRILLSLLYYFCAGSSVSETCKILNGDVTKKTVIQWFNYFRDVMTTH